MADISLYTPMPFILHSHSVVFATLVQACIQPEPARRPTCSQLLQMPYLQDAAHNMSQALLAAQVCPALEHLPFLCVLHCAWTLPCRYMVPLSLHTAPVLTKCPVLGYVTLSSHSVLSSASALSLDITLCLHSALPFPSALSSQRPLSLEVALSLHIAFCSSASLLLFPP